MSIGNTALFCYNLYWMGYKRVGSEVLLNDAIKLGPFLIKYYYLFIFISGCLAYIMMRYRLRLNLPLREFVLNQLTNGVILWIIIWKFSYAIFNSSKAIANPQTILFFTGGKSGVVAATIITLIYLFVKLWNNNKDKKNILDVIIVGGFSFFISFYLILLFFGHNSPWSLMKLLVLGTLFLLYLYKDLEQQERKETMKKVIAIIVFIGLIGYTIYTTAFTEQTAVEGLEKGNLAPDFELTTLDGDKVKLSDFRGKKVLLNFWASWCGPCRAEMPDMQELHKEGRDDLVILAVNATQTEKGKESPAEFIKELGLTFPTVLDEKGEVSKKYQVIALPTSYFIDSEGKINEKYTGTLSYEQMVNGISKLD